MLKFFWFTVCELKERPPALQMGRMKKMFEISVKEKENGLEFIHFEKIDIEINIFASLVVRAENIIKRLKKATEEGNTKKIKAIKKGYTILNLINKIVKVKIPCGVKHFYSIYDMADDVRRALEFNDAEALKDLSIVIFYLESIEKAKDEAKATKKASKAKAKETQPAPAVDFSNFQMPEFDAAAFADSLKKQMKTDKEIKKDLTESDPGYRTASAIANIFKNAEERKTR